MEDTEKLYAHTKSLADHTSELTEASADHIPMVIQGLLPIIHATLQDTMDMMSAHIESSIIHLKEGIDQIHTQERVVMLTDTKKRMKLYIAHFENLKAMIS